MSFGITRAFGWLAKRRRGRRFSIQYTRDRDWKLPNELKLRGKRVALALPQDRGTAVAFKDIFISDVYGLESLPVNPSTVLDVGAHAGLFSLAIAIYFPQATIHAYEPNPCLWDYLKRQAGLVGFQIFPQAVGGASGRASLQEGKDSVFARCTPERNGQIVVTAISEAIYRLAAGSAIDLLKLDCEGAEWEILADTEAMRQVRYLTMEYHLDGASLEQLLKLLARGGFEVEFIHRDGTANGRIRARNIHLQRLQQ